MLQCRINFSYNKKYDTKKHIHHRFSIFKKNLKHIKRYQNEELGTAVYGVTEFSDMTPHEWKKVCRESNRIKIGLQTYLPYVWEEPVYMNKVADLHKEGINVSAPSVP